MFPFLNDRVQPSLFFIFTFFIVLTQEWQINRKMPLLPNFKRCREKRYALEELHPLCPLSNFSFISTNLKGYMASPWLMLYPRKILLANSADGAPDCLGTNLKSKQTINQKSTFSVPQSEEAFSQFPHAITTLTINISWSYMQWQPLFGGSSSLWP